MEKNKNSDYYHPIALFGWFVLFLSIVQTILVPIPFLYILSAVVWIVVLLVKKMETADPNYIPLEKTPVSADLKTASFAVKLAAVFPIFVWIGWFFIIAPGATIVFPVLAPVIGTLSFVIVIMISIPLMALMWFTSYIMKKMNYGNPVF